MRFPLVLAVFITGSLATLDFQCWNFQQTNEIRHEYRKRVNELRIELAQGKAANKEGSCPAGSNIYRLDWDCILENYAQEAVNQCLDAPKVDDKVLEKVSMVYNKTTLTTCNPMPLFKEQVNIWWNDVKTVGLGPDAAFDDGLKNFAVLANGLATRIGCAQKNCKGDLHMACMVYGKAASSPGQTIYEVGKGCTADSDCTTYKESKCLKNKNFCLAGYPTNETAVPPTVGTTTTTTTKTTTTATTTTTTAKKPGTNESKHCKGQEAMNADPARDQLLTLHNQYRAATAKGEVMMKNGKHTRKCPMMKKLSYNCDLEKTAYAIAERCLSADPNTNNENWFATTTTAATNKRMAAEQAVASWYNEIKNGSMEQEIGSQNLLLPRLGVTHFARMVWGTNDKIGCGIYKCNNKHWHVVCRYGPGVGTPGNPIYRMGATCNQCKEACIDGGLCP
ncbi:hypothetical protein Aduo_006656 [Ancylostoma duodenale]